MCTRSSGRPPSRHICGGSCCQTRSRGTLFSSWSEMSRSASVIVMKTLGLVRLGKSTLTNFATTFFDYAHILSRTLWSTTQAMQKKLPRLSLFSGLHELSVNCKHEGLATQHLFIKTMLCSLTVGLPTYHSLKNLTLTHLARIDAPLLRLVSSTFPLLEDLYLSCTERIHLEHCWACFEESLSCVEHSPIGETCFSHEELAVSAVPFSVYADCPCEFLDHLCTRTQATCVSDTPPSWGVRITRESRLRPSRPRSRSRRFRVTQCFWARRMQYLRAEERRDPNKRITRQLAYGSEDQDFTDDRMEFLLCPRSPGSGFEWRGSGNHQRSRKRDRHWAT
jgi:hypothetical protein